MTSSNHHRSRGLSLKANFSWTFAGNVVNAASLFGMTIVLARLGTPADVGSFTLGLATTAPIFMFATLRLRDVQATDSKQDYQFGDYYALRLLTTAMAMSAVVGLVLLSRGQRDIALVILATAVSKSVEAVSDAIYGLFMQQERLDRIAKSLMLKGPLSLLGLGIGFAATRSVFWGIVGLTLARALVLAVYDFRNANVSLNAAADTRRHRPFADIPRPCWRWPTLWKLLRLTLPLGMVTMLISFNTNIPRYLIEWHLGAYQLGIFAAVAAFQKTAPTVVQALGRSAQPSVGQVLREQQCSGFHALFYPNGGDWFCAWVGRVSGRRRRRTPHFASDVRSRVRGPGTLPTDHAGGRPGLRGHDVDVRHYFRQILSHSIALATAGDNRRSPIVLLAGSHGRSAGAMHMG